MARFMRKGKAKVYFVTPKPADLAAISAAVVTGAGGTNLTPELGEVSGFTFANSPIQTPNMDEAFTPQIGGEDTAADSSLGLYEQDDNSTIKDDLAKGVPGVVLFFHRGIAGAAPAAGDAYEAFPGVITSNARTYTVANEAAMYNVSFSIDGTPEEGVLVV